MSARPLGRYTWDEIEWDHTFAQCVFNSERGPQTSPRGKYAEGGCRIDFTKFHDLEPAPVHGDEQNCCSPPASSSTDATGTSVHTTEADEVGRGAVRRAGSLQQQ